MTVMEYMAKFIELAYFVDNYVATNIAKVRILENGLKLSIRGKIVRLLPTRQGIYGRGGSDHRETDRGRMKHPRCGCQWKEEGESVLFQFKKEAKGF